MADTSLDVFLLDRRTAQEIQDYVSNQEDDANLGTTILAFMEIHGAKFNAVWLLKTWLQSGYVLDEKQTSTFLKYMHGVTNDLAILLTMRCAENITLSDEDLAAWELIMHKCKESDNKFTQAHYYNGFIPMVRLNPTFYREAMNIIDAEYLFASKSGQARIRAIRKLLLQYAKN